VGVGNADRDGLHRRDPHRVTAMASYVGVEGCKRILRSPPVAVSVAAHPVRAWAWEQVRTVSAATGCAGAGAPSGRLASA
ncbi:MAG: hypothetical protein LC118_04245, partial [Dehalococcoidia bacterium]|nr:hypothetical protein [Dehalococcoidia bacterium]